MKETWKPIKGYEGLYEVSDLGNVKSLDYRHSGKERNLKLVTVTGGYKAVNLFNNGEHITRTVHSLVAETFIQNPDGFTEINHKDEDKSNNRANNLEWCSRLYNCRYGTRNQKISRLQKKSWSDERRARYKGANHPRARSVKCCETGEVYPTIAECSRKTGICQSLICRACSGRSQSAHSLHFTYAQLL